MSQELAITDLILNASLLVQIVMGMLVLASLVSWIMIFQRAIFLRGTASEMADFESKFWSGMDLAQLYREVSKTAVSATSGMENIFRAGFKEYARLRQQSNNDPDTMLAGCQRAMRVALSKEEEKLDTHLPFLATVGSTSPYIGLFGTVWGIMNSFRGLANQAQVSLAVVAPGISEALIATAMGLFAAIPAVIAYNRYSARVDNMVNQYETFTEEFAGILHRSLHARTTS